MASSHSKEGVKQTHSLRDFKGVNTQAARQNIGDDEFAWLENVCPVGFGNMRAMLGPSGILASWAPDTAYYVQTANLNDTDYYFVFTTNGAAYTVDLENYTLKKFAPTGTFNGSGTAMAQWENLQICIIDPVKGYFTYDGSTLTLWSGTIQNLTITTLGTGYTSSPTISIAAPGGGGTTATATSDIQVGLAQLSDPGSGYAVNDVLTAAGGTFVTPAVLTVSAVNGSGVITGINLTDTGDYTIAPSGDADLSGGYGSGATVTLNFGIGPITVTNIGSGYTSNPVVTITSTSGTGGAATANISVVPSVGTSISTFSGRVWVGNDRTIVFSAPDSFNDFSTGTFGGSFVMVDETLNSSIQSMLSANNYLYVLGTTSVNLISGVQIVSNATVFSNTNISASVGSAQNLSVIAYYRAIAFCTPYGFYILSGTTPQKISDHLDGIFPDIGNAIPISAGTVNVFNVICLAFMFEYLDPINGPRTLIAVLFNKKWLFTSQGDDLTLMATSLIGGVPTLYATDGQNLFQLLSSSSVAISQTIETKLWDMGDPVRDKQILKVGVESITTNYNSTIDGTIVTEIPDNTATFNALQSNSANVQWVNGLGQSVNWRNGTGGLVNWKAFYSGYFFNKADVETSGKYVGVTLQGNAPEQTYSAIHLQYEMRASWTTMPT